MGDSVSAALFKYYDGTNFGFRLRLGAQDNQNQGYQSAAFIGMDITGDAILDFYIGVEIDGVGTGSEKLDIGIYQFATGGAVSPSTTQGALANAANYIAPFGYEQTSTNFNWSQVSDIDTVDPYNVDGQLDNQGNAQPDYFLTFIVPFDDIITAFSTVVSGFNATTAMSFVAITSQNLNQVNNDFSGIDDSNLNNPYGGTPGDPNNPGGGLSQPYTPESEVPVPEPSACALLVSLWALCLVFSRRKLA